MRKGPRRGLRKNQVHCFQCEVYGPLVIQCEDVPRIRHWGKGLAMGVGEYHKSGETKILGGADVEISD